MPCADTRSFEALLAQCQRAGLDTCRAETAGGPEPLFAVYRASVLACVRAALEAGERRMLAFERFPRADGLLPRTGQLELDAQLAWNVNTPADLERVRAWSTTRAGALA